FHATQFHSGGVDTLEWAQDSRATPSEDEIEIEVQAVGLNFMNVMSVLGIYPGYDAGRGPLGIECAGRVRRVGSRVRKFAPGDLVAAMGTRCLARYTTTHEELAIRLPEAMSAIH